MRRKYGMMIFITAIMVLSLFQVERASADLIWEPSNDSFFRTHRGECQHVGRVYIANGPDGELVVYKSPEDPGIVTKVPNGSTFTVSFIYQDKDGITWAVYNDFTTDIIGWVPYDYLVVKYDNISFQEEFGEQIVSEHGQLDSEWSKQKICTWPYPGSSTGSTMIISSEYMPEYSASYTDEAGRKWVYGGYYMGHRNYWVCIDAPTDDYASLYPEGSTLAKRLQAETIESVEPGIVPEGEDATEITEIVPEGEDATEITEIVPSGKKTASTMIWLGVLIGAVIAVSLILLRKLKKKHDC